MEGQEIKITMDHILKTFEAAKDEKRPKDIKSAIIASLNQDGSLFANQEINFNDIDKSVDKLLASDKKSGRDSFLIYNKGKYKKRRNKKPLLDASILIPEELEESPIANKSYIGRAGECAVMSELLFRGYNANHMMVDDGVDIIAAKENIYYYVQVKTASVKNGKIQCQIGIESFERYIENQIRYVIVARYKDRDTKIDHNRFYVFTPSHIAKYVFDKCISKGVKGYSIKIKFDERTGKPILYDEKETGIEFHENHFEMNQ